MPIAAVRDDELANIPPAIAALIPALNARRLRAVPLGFTGDQPPALRVAMRDPQDPIVLEQLRLLSGHRIVPVSASSMQLGRALDQHYASIALPVRARAAPSTDKDAWKRAPLPEGHDEDGMLHDGSGAMGRYLLGAVVVAVVAFVGLYLRIERRQEARADQRRDRHVGEILSGRVDAPEVGVSLDLGAGSWRRSVSGPEIDRFVRVGPGGAALGELGVHRWWDEAAADVEGLRAVVAARDGHPYGPDDCEDSDERAPPSLECHDGPVHTWVWTDGDDALAIRYVDDGERDLEALEDVVRSVQ